MKIAHRQSGFTLLETILSLALIGLLIGMMATLVRQWVINWNRGGDRIEQLEAVTLAENKLAKDLNGALVFPVHPDRPLLSFSGSATKIAFIREPLSRETSRQLRVILYESDDQTGLTRRVALYDGITPFDRLPFTEAVTLLPAPYHVTFSFRDREGERSDNWVKPGIPAEISTRIMAANAQAFSERVISPAVSSPYACARVLDLKNCDAILVRGQIPSAVSQPQNPNKNSNQNKQEKQP